jgi:hypothetical protein
MNVVRGQLTSAEPSGCRNQPSEQFVQIRIRLESVKRARPLSAYRVSRVRPSIMEKMERLLSIWIDHENQKNVSLNVSAIKERAKKLYRHLKKVESVPSDVKPFNASHGWFERFKKRYSLPTRVAAESAGIDSRAAEKFTQVLLGIIDEGGYSAKQVFNFGETRLYWKRMPNGVHVSMDERQSGKDYCTLLLGGNAEGDYKLKPLMIYDSKIPKAFKSCAQETLPVIWHSNTEASKIHIFENYLSDYLYKELENYCKTENLEFKILLLLDSALEQIETVVDSYDNVNVVFLPPKTAPLLQPMNQGATATFKAYYFRRSLAKLIEKTNGGGKQCLKEFFDENYTIKDAIDVIAASWDEVSSLCMNGIWCKIWPQCVKDFQNFDKALDVTEELVSMAKKSGFDEVEESDIVELLESDCGELSNDELEELDSHREVEDEDQTADSATCGLTRKRLSEAFKHIEAAMSIFKEDDFEKQRSVRVCHMLENSIDCYKQIYNEKLTRRGCQFLEIKESSSPRPSLSVEGKLSLGSPHDSDSAVDDF